MKNKIVAGLAAVSMILISVANAESSAPKQAQKILRSGNASSTELSVKINEFKASTTEARANLSEQIKSERDAFQSAIKTLKQNFQDKRKAEQEALKVKLQAIKDQNKRNTTLNLDNNMNDLSGKFVNTWSEALIKLDDQLTKIVGQASTTAANATDVSSVNTAIDLARTAISAAKSSLQVQAAKTYTITVTTDAKLKADVSATRTQLNNDLKSVKDLVEKARQAVIQALTELNKVKKSSQSSASTTSQNR